MYTVTYAYLDILCIIVLAFILYRLTRSLYASTTDRSFSSVVINVMMTLALDAACILISGVNLTASRILNAAFLTWTGIVGYSWLIYTRTVLGYTESPRAIEVVQVIPAVFLAFVCFMSIRTGWVFWIDPTSITYHRGPYHFVQILLAASYLVASASLILFKLHASTSTQQRKELLTLTSFLVLPIIGVILDSLFYGVPFTWTLCTVAVLIVFVNFQEYSISTDPLTDLNNRRLFESRTRSLIEGCDASHPVYLLLMDVDDFKSINDTYGHRTGDRALIEVASLLKDAANDHRLFIARYGGDEFAIVGQLDTPADAAAIKAEVQAAFDTRNRTTANPYPLMLSIGMAKSAGDGTDTVDSLVARADKGLYAEKAAHNAAKASSAAIAS